MQRLKIALIVHDLHTHGGHSVYTRVLADELARRHEVTVFANRCERPADAYWQFQHVRAMRRNAVSTVYTFPPALRLQRARLAQYDIRHAQGYCGGEPNVVTAHICVAAYLNSLRDASPRHRLALRMMAAAESRFYRSYEGRVIAISRKIARELREFYGLQAEIRMIPHGVDVARFEHTREQHRADVRRELGIREDETVALYVGDLTKSQAYLKALSAAASGVRLVIITGSRVYHWHAPNVQILPPTSELEQYYAAADAFVFPTTYDAFGMVLLEAMASGLPVFSSNCAGATELIDSGSDGFVFGLDDWVEATAAALQDRGSLRAIGDEAEKTARAHDWHTVVREVEQLYLQVVSERDALVSQSAVSAYRYQG